MPKVSCARWAWAGVLAAYVLVVTGAAMAAYGADGAPLLGWVHRALTAVVGALAVWAAACGLRDGGEGEGAGAQQGRLGLRRWFLAALVLLLAQVLLGLVGVRQGDAAWLGAAHTGVGMAFLSVWVVLAVSAGMKERGERLLAARATWAAPLAAAVAAYVTLVSGRYVSGMVGLCGGWPLCGGDVSSGERVLAYGHRVAALLALVLVLYAGYGVVRRGLREPALVVPAGVAAGLVYIEVLLGGVAVEQGLPAGVRVTHVGVAAALVGTLVALTVSAYVLGDVAAGVGVWAGVGGSGCGIGERLRRVPGRLLAYVELMKPRVMLLILLTGFVAMWVAGGGRVSWGVVVYTLVGLLLTGGGANAVNMWYDRDIDVVMWRTRGRPLPSGRLAPWEALVFGIGAGLAGVTVLAVAVNLLAAALALAGYVYYVMIYTMWLKRWSSQNIVIGGGSGAIPPLVGWAAVTGEVSVAAVLMFLVVFLWTPPHFWALALYRGEEYRRAGVPMLPVVRGAEATKWQMVVYALLMVPVSLLLYWTGVVGPWYLWAAVALGAWFAGACVWLWRRCRVEAAGARRVFGYSIVYLAALFLAMVLDVSR